MDENEDITQKKTLRLKKAPSGGSAEDLDSPASSIGTITSGGGRPTPGRTTQGSCKGAAIVALVATLIFTALVVLQVMELQTYKYAFPRPQLQTLP